MVGRTGCRENRKWEEWGVGRMGFGMCKMRTEIGRDSCSFMADC